MEKIKQEMSSRKNEIQRFISREIMTIFHTYSKYTISYHIYEFFGYL